MFPNVADEIYGGDLRGEISKRIDLLAPPLSAENATARPELLAQTEVIFSGWGAPRMDEKFLRQAPRLRAIFYAAGSVRPWATEAVWQREIVVTTAAAANAVPVAEYTAAAITLSLKQIWRYCRDVRNGPEGFARIPCAGSFRSKVGLVSLGLIARKVAAKLRETDLELLAHDPFVSRTEAAAIGVKLVGLEEIFQSCDVISLHPPLLPTTRGLIGKELLGAMRPGATLINTSRGEIIREAELIEVLRQRADLTAVLDVTAPEPPAPDSPLYSLPNVILTPHVAGSLDRECRRLGEAMIADFDRWQRGEPMVGQLSEAQAALTA